MLMFENLVRMKKTFSMSAVALLLAATTVSPAFAGRIRRGPTSPKAHSTKTASHTAHSSKTPVGPRSIDDGRATQIQGALIRAGYLSGEPSGHWDASSQAAMEKLQSDNGWQTKLVPDSRALIKLGLGPGAETTASTAAASIPNANE